MSKKRYIAIFAVSIVLVIGAVFVYMNQLSNTVSGNLMTAVDEISRHDVESIEGTLDDSYSRLESVAKRMEVYDVQTVAEAQEQLNLEAASSRAFNAIYLLDADGTLYSSSYVRFAPESHSYDEMMKDGRDHFVMLYDDANGKLETTKESLIYGIALRNMQFAGHDFVAMLGRSDLSNIRDQLLIESFDNQGVSSVVNAQGYYIVSASPATDLSGRDNFYDMLNAGLIEDGVTVDDVRRNISDGESFVINCTRSDGERLVLSFAPVAGTSWSFILAVPMRVFEQRFAPFITLTAGMLVVVVIVLIVMMSVLYRFMKRSVSARAESAARAEFLSNMSHEIRTPLNGIIGLNHLMESNLDDSEAMKGYVSKLGKAAQYLLALVNDILDVSKLQAGKVVLAHEPFDLYNVMENVCEMQREPIDERGIDFDMQGNDLPFPYLIGDETRLSQVLMNILSNAVKFTPEGGSISFRATQQLMVATHEVHTVISVSDTGCGMSPEFQQSIFDAFTQERNSNSDSQKGTGLGMAISFMLVQQMGGRLSVESELGKGSCFTVDVTLPLDQSRLAELPHETSNATPLPGGVYGKDAAQGEGGPGAPDGAPPKTVNLLIAEDNELNSDILVAILGKEGYNVELAVNGAEAVEAFERSEEGFFDAILMDAQMPVMDGYEASRRIRGMKRPDAKAVRIFACTASTFAEDRGRALDAGMDDFLAKPLDVPVMLRKLRELGGGER